MERFFKRATLFLNRAPELWKENLELYELNRRFLWFIFLRCGVVMVCLLFGLAKNWVIPHISISQEVLFAAAGLLFILNIFYWFYYEWAIGYHTSPVSAKLVAGNVQVQIIIDFLILGLIAYQCGGLESPLIYFFLFHNVLSCLFFKRTISFFHTAATVLIIITIFALTKLDIIPERHFINPAFSNVMTIPRDFAAYYLFGVVSVYFVVWYLVSSITGSLRRYERELQQKIEEMIELAHEKTRYLLVTTHELKAPFAAIQSYVNVALDGYAGEVSEKVKEILVRIRTRCDLLSNMIISMIQLANITSIKEHKRDVERKRTDVCQIVSKLLPQLMKYAAARKVRFKMEDMGKGCYIDANSEQLDIMFNNVLMNAVSYSYSDTYIVISAEEKGGKVIVSVSDRGIGIKKENLDKVFLEYFRTEKAAILNPNSTGLGLTIAREVMNIHNGRIWIESVEGEGTEVFMEFPVSTL